MYHQSVEFNVFTHAWIEAMQATIAVIGTLLGALFGAFATYWSQRSTYTHEAAEHLTATRRQAYGAWLVDLQVMYRAMDDIDVKVRAGTLALDRVPEALFGIPATAGQGALELVRFIGDDTVVNTAGDLWDHMRRLGPAACGRTEWRDWQDTYYNLRRLFIDQARIENGQKAINWSLAAAGDAHHERGH